MLTYLLVSGDRAHSREHLAELFWPEQPPHLSRQNLRKTLSRIRQELDHPEDGLLVDRQTIRLRPDAYSVDARHFRALLAQCEVHPHPDPVTCPECAQRLALAVTYYRDPLFRETLDLESQEFEGWLLTERERFHGQAVHALQTLVRHHQHLGHHDQVAHYARRLVDLLPYQEAARLALIQALACLGQRDAALAQYERSVIALREGLGIAPGEALRDLHQQISRSASGDALAQSMAQAAAQTGQLHHFPQAATPFFGRQAEIAQIRKMLADPNCRLLTVTGPGGMGKSRLIVEAARHLDLARYPDGIYFVPLAALDRTEEMLLALAGAVEIGLIPGQPVQRQLVRGLAKRRLLLVMDNFEHLSRGAPLLAELLTHCPGISILSSSRQPLQIQAEWTLPLEGLTYPPTPDAMLPADAAHPGQEYSAVAFFLERGQRARPDFSPTPADHAAILAICRLVQGMPLALAMAASWLSVYDLPGIQAQMDESLGFFRHPDPETGETGETGNGADADWPARHRSMRATFAISWQLLPPSAQRTLARLSIFRGSFDIKAVQQVTQAAPLDLMHLVTASLLDRSGRDRYALHELTRQFAVEKREELGEGEGVRMAHSRYYLALLSQEQRTLRGEAQPEAIHRLRPDQANIYAAWSGASRLGQWDLLAESLSAFEAYLLVSATRADGRGLVMDTGQRLAEAMTGPPSLRPAPAHVNGAPHTPQSQQQRILLARLKLAEGKLALTYAPYEVSTALLQQSLDLAEPDDGLSIAHEAQRQPDPLLGEIHANLAAIYNQQGRRQHAERHVLAAQHHLQNSTHYAIQSSLYLTLSSIMSAKGDVVWLQRYTEEAVRLGELSGDLMVENEARRYLLHRQFRMGDFSNALHHLERLTQIAHALQSTLAWVQARHFYAGYHFQVGNLDEMAAIHAEIMPTLRQIGNPLMISVATMRELVYNQRRLNLGSALAVVERALTFATTYQIVELEALGLTSRGVILLGLGDMEGATADLERSIFLLQRQADRTDLRSALLARAMIHLAEGEKEAALSLAEPVLSIIRANGLGNLVDRASFLAQLCRVYLACHHPQTRELIEWAYAMQSEMAQSIPNPAHRHTFWQNVPDNREIAWLYQHRHQPYGHDPSCPYNGSDRISNP